MAVKQAGCIFCEQGVDNDSTLYVNESFYVRVGLGLIAPGHVLVVSREHYGCFGEMPGELDEEYERFAGMAAGAVSEGFADPFLLEYGRWGQSVPHAHTHLIPSEGPGYRVESLVDEMVRPCAEVRVEEGSIARLRQVLEEEGAYVSIGERGRLNICHVDRIPRFDSARPHPNLNYRLFFRERGAESVRCWTTMTAKDIAADEERRMLTKDRLAGVFARIQ